MFQFQFSTVGNVLDKNHRRILVLVSFREPISDGATSPVVTVLQRVLKGQTEAEVFVVFLIMVENH